MVNDNFHILLFQQFCVKNFHETKKKIYYNNFQKLKISIMREKGVFFPLIQRLWEWQNKN